MKKLYLIVIAAIFASGCASIPNPKGENCTLQAPPKDASAYRIITRFLFMYPNVIPDNYTGCQIIWVEGGYRWFILHFEYGVPDIVGQYIGNNPSIAVSCKIKDLEEKPDLGNCPNHMILRDFRKGKFLFNDKVPPDRDPRR